MKLYLSNNPTKKTVKGLIGFAFSASDSFELVVRKVLGLFKKAKSNRNGRAISFLKEKREFIISSQLKAQRPFY